jgi:hypothetical protein
MVLNLCQKSLEDVYCIVSIYCIVKFYFISNILYHRKFMRHVKRQNPEKRCLIQYDKLLIDGKMFVYNDFKGMVEEQNLPPSMTLQEAITR